MSLRRRWDEFLNPKPSRRPGPFYWFLAVVILVLAVYVAAGILASTRRTADAPIEVVSTTRQLSGGRSAPREGWVVSYEFRAADGETYAGEAFRTWTLDEIRASHACYEPSNPANHELIHASVACAPADLVLPAR